MFAVFTSWITNLSPTTDLCGFLTWMLAMKKPSNLWPIVCAFFWELVVDYIFITTNASSIFSFIYFFDIPTSRGKRVMKFAGGTPTWRLLLWYNVTHQVRQSSTTLRRCILWCSHFSSPPPPTHLPCLRNDLKKKKPNAWLSARCETRVVSSQWSTLAHQVCGAPCVMVLVHLVWCREGVARKPANCWHRCQNASSSWCLCNN